MSAYEMYLSLPEREQEIIRSAVKDPIAVRRRMMLNLYFADHTEREIYELMTRINQEEENKK